MVRRKKYFLTVLALVAILSMLFTGLALAAQIAIDHFDEAPVGGTASTVIDAGGGGPTSGSSTGTTSISERDVIVDATVGTGNLTFQTVTESPPSIYHYMQFLADAGVQGSITVQWDGDTDSGSPTLDPTGLGGIDLTDSTSNRRFHIEVVGSSTPVLLTIEVYTDANNWSYYDFNVPVILAGDHVDFSPRFGNFTQGGTGPVDFTDVGAVVVKVDSAATNSSGTDFRLDFVAATAFADYGDAPASYDLNDPASHSSDGLVRLGENIDTEDTVLSSPLANGDDLDQSDDEDGVTPVGQWTTNGTIDVDLEGYLPPRTNACLSAWIDFGEDGTFDPGDKVLDREPLTALGVSQISFSLLGNSVTNTSKFARFRLMPEIGTPDGDCTNETAIGPKGYQEYGEVEDYLWSFSSTAVTISSLKASPVISNRDLLIPMAGLLGLVGVGLFLFARRRQA